MKAALLVFLLLFSVLVSAKTQFFADPQGDHYLVSHESEGKWFLDRYLVRPGQLQEHLEQKAFSSEADLKKYLSRYPFHQKFFSPDKSRYVQTEMQRPLWEVRHEWSEEWELKFSQWAATEFDQDFYVRYNIVTDCADVAYSMRWIFARMHGLPAAATFAGSGVIFSQDSFRKEWSKLKRHKDWHQDELFREALNYLLRNVYTGTLRTDGYPIHISKETFLPGTIHLNGGHTMIISKIDYAGKEAAPIWKLSSTMPPMVRVLREEMMIDSFATDEAQGGYLRMRWPVKQNQRWGLVPKEKMPHYSREQYTEEFKAPSGHFALAVIERLGIDFNPQKIVRKAGESLLDDLQERLSIVETGVTFCAENNCEEGTMAYEDHSTPSRDKRLDLKFKDVRSMARTLSNLDPQLPAFVQKYFSSTTFAVPGSEKTLLELEEIFRYRLASHHPEDSLEERWASTPADAVSQIKKRGQRLFKKRDEMLKAASFCAGNESCRRGGLNWEKHQSYELDEKLKLEVFAALDILCQKHQHCETGDALLNSRIKTIPFLISEPEFTPEQRNGKSVTSFIVPPAKRTFQLKGPLFILDRDLVILGERTILEGATALIYDDFQDLTVALKDQRLLLFNSRGVVLDEAVVPSEFEKLEWIGKKLLFASKCENLASSLKCSGVVWRLTGQSFSQVKEFDYYDSPFMQQDQTPYLSQKNYLAVKQHLEGQELSTLLLFSLEGELRELSLIGNYSASEHAHGILLKQSEENLLIREGKIQCAFRANVSSLGRGSDLLIKYGDGMAKGEVLNLSPECALETLLVMNDSWPWVMMQGNTGYIHEQQASHLYYWRDQELRTLKKKKNEHVLIYREDHVLLGEVNAEAKITSAQLYDLSSGQRKDVPVHYLPWECHALSSLCQGELELLSYFKGESEYVAHHVGHQNGEPLFSSREFINQDSPEGDILMMGEQARRVIKTGSLIHVAEETWVFVP